MNTNNQEINLKIILPTKILLEVPAIKVTAEADNGSFCLLPRHIDFVTTLVPSILFFVSPEEKEEFLAIDRGILIKQGYNVTVSTQNAVKGQDLGMLQQTIIQEFKTLSEREKTAHSVLAKLEISTIKRFMELNDVL